MDFEINGALSNSAETKFGIREIRSELNANGKRVFSINGKKFLIRGGGWSPDRSEEHTSELQSQSNLVCRLLLEKKKHCTINASPRSSSTTAWSSPDTDRTSKSACLTAARTSPTPSDPHTTPRPADAATAHDTRH